VVEARRPAAQGRARRLRRAAPHDARRGPPPAASTRYITRRPSSTYRPAASASSPVADEVLEVAVLNEHGTRVGPSRRPNSFLGRRRVHRDARQFGAQGRGGAHPLLRSSTGHYRKCKWQLLHCHGAFLPPRFFRCLHIRQLCSVVKRPTRHGCATTVAFAVKV
jgi:hypothetical protein